jgi:hypothetical protein
LTSGVDAAARYGFRDARGIHCVVTRWDALGREDPSVALKLKNLDSLIHQTAPP